MGMAPLALYLRSAGHQVCGCDDHPRPEVAALLRRAGLELLPPTAVPPQTTRVVFSSAVPPAHPVRQAAEGRRLPILRRGRLLAEISARHRLVAVVGSHGKTTTTALLVSALGSQHFPVSHVLGGLFQGDSLPPAAFTAESDWLVAEVDESDGTIEHFSPEVTVVVNFDWDHPDHYRTAADLEEAFGRLFSRTRGAVLIPVGDPVLERLAPRAPRVLRYGPGGDLEIVSHQTFENSQKLSLDGPLLASGSNSSLATHHSSLASVAVTVAATGPFNRHNSLAALAASILITGSAPAGECLASFPGVRRRQNVLFERPGLTVLEDYAHHPAEIAALFTHARERWPERRLVCVFQPHRYTRTRQYRADFARVLDRADVVVLKETYAASEVPLEYGHASDILALMAHPKAAIVENFEALSATLDRATAPASNSSLITHHSSLASVVLFVGAGDIEEWGHETARRLLGREQWWTSLRTALSPETLLERDAPLGSRTTLGVGGRAAFYAEPAGEADLSYLLGSLRSAAMPFFILGRGSNLIVDDEGYAGLVIRLSGAAWCRLENLGGGRLLAGAGVSLKKLCAFAGQEGLGGFEFLEGIPGTVGGSLRMNAGAMGGWIFDVVAEVRLMTREGDIHHLPRSRFHVDYRSCAELKDAVALGAVLEGVPALPADIRTRMAALAEKRKGSQPRAASAGCAFKNPAGDSAGRLIDSLGLKGRSVGQAEVSPVHANFIVNRGAATSADVLALLRDIRCEVKTRSGIELEPEVLLLGNEWSEVLKDPATPSFPSVFSPPGPVRTPEGPPHKT